MEKLKSMPYAQAHIERSFNRVTLVSYVTTVAEIVGGVLVVYGLHSVTTRKHIGAFARQFGMDYRIAKKCYTDKVGYDLITKKFIPV